ncbi:bifunctional TVP38/TMEM64 family protein/FAD-dependent oxidoreductase [Oleiagrimonas sp.]|uniref:FAD-dependent oxidoreductase n=1 Tax=Oleiagrimonas sp. TaxID=2010330 RepID=UPI002620F99F|nr:bifunctional TVP38/TMEM64 family protein/FAD-dependent oxidoreductase [Oleiagrimonas sp.]MDA3914068.1 FAD-dependent oxidoreductase [Oleiagrimonas sp.]
MRRWLVLALLVAAVIAFYALHLGDLFSLSGVQQGLAHWRALQAQAPYMSALVFMAAYVVMAALSLPGAALLTLVAGALFGLWEGTLLVSFASSIGALLAMLTARYVLRQPVQKRWGARLERINQGVRKDGAFYLFSLRLVPVVPFFVVNLAFGLTPLRAWTFYWVSQVGMLAGTFVYVNAGRALGDLHSLSGILSLPLIGSFALLALFPWGARWLVARLRLRRVYAGYRRPGRFDRNLIVIGAGSAGLVSTFIARTVKAKVTLIESHKMGGDCLNYGCVPSKALIRSARLAHQMRHAERYGLPAVEPQAAYPQVLARVQRVIGTVAPHDSVERYTQMGAEVLLGHARVVDPWTVEVRLEDGQTRRLTTRAIVLATGAEPVVPEIPGIADSGYVTSDTLWERLAGLDTPPRRIIVLGGGPIGSELSQALARLGSEVTQIERGTRLLQREDEEVSAAARAFLETDGVRVLTSAEAVACHSDTVGQRHLRVHQGEQVLDLPFDLLVCATGRKARLAGYGLEELGIETERSIVTDAYLQTRFPNILAAGDAAGPYQFTHVAAHQAWYATVNALFGSFKRFRPDYRVIPWTTFIDPEVARVGLNEQQARAQGVDYEVTRYDLDDLDRAIADEAAHGFIKILTPPGKDRILGVTIVGAHGAELLAEFVLAMRWKLGLGKILSTIHTYPTFAEANKYAAGVWRKAHAPERVLPWLERFHAWRRR